MWEVAIIARNVFLWGQKCEDRKLSSYKNETKIHGILQWCVVQGNKFGYIDNASKHCSTSFTH